MDQTLLFINNIRKSLNMMNTTIKKNGQMDQGDYFLLNLIREKMQNNP